MIKGLDGPLFLGGKKKTPMKDVYIFMHAADKDWERALSPSQKMRTRGK